MATVREQTLFYDDDDDDDMRPVQYSASDTARLTRGCINQGVKRDNQPVYGDIFH